MKVLVIYHGRCTDGTVAAWCAERYFSEQTGVEVECYPAVHNKPPPFKRVTRADRTYILDFCYPREELIKISEMTELIVLDHHKSFEAQCHGLDFCTFDMTRSGASMAWDYFFPENPRPWLINYVETQDLWTWDEPDADAVMAYLDTLPRSFDTYDDLHSGKIPFSECVEKGKAILSYINQANAETIKAGVRYITFESPGGTLHVDVPIVNASFFGMSRLLSRISQGHSMALGWFRRYDGKYQFSVRVSEDSDFDASKFAVEFGGGGHVKASGFSLHHQIHECTKPHGATSGTKIDGTPPGVQTC